MKRKTLDQLDLDLVFTEVMSSGGLGLLFGRISGEDIFSSERIVSLLDSTFVHKHCGLPLTATKVINDGSLPYRWFSQKSPLTPKIETQLHIYRPSTENLKTFLTGKDQKWFRDVCEAKQLNPEEEYYSCTLPHKHILGCSACLQDYTILPSSCRIKRMHRRGAFTAIDEVHDLRQIRQDITFKSGIKYGEFTYLSPKHTNPKFNQFSDRLRDLDFHQFRVIPERIREFTKLAKDNALKALITKERYKTVCPDCFAKEGCWTHAKDKSWDDRKRCRMPYPKTEKEVIDRILEKIKIPYSNKDLRFLMSATGPLKNKYQRTTVAGTFYINQDKVLRYALVAVKQVRRRGFKYCLYEPTGIKKYLKEKQGIEPPTNFCTPLTKRHKANLLVAAATHHTPNYGEWSGHVTREKAYLEVGMRGDMRLYFVGRGTSILRWEFLFKDLERYHAFYRYIPIQDWDRK